MADVQGLITLAKNEDWNKFQRDYQTTFPNATETDIGVSYIAFQSMEGTPSSVNTSAGSKTKYSPTGGRPDSVVGWIQKFLETQETEISGDQGEFLTVKKGIDTFFDEKGKFRGVLGSLKEMAMIIPDQIAVSLQQTTELLTDMNTTAGMTGELSRQFREEIMAASPEVIRLGISFSEMSDSVATVLEESGKFRLLGRDTIEQLGLVSKFTTSMKDFPAMGRSFENIGLGIRDMTREVEEAGHSSLELGLNARITVRDMNENLSKLNEYGFRDGVQGLTRMAQLATEFRMDMNQAFQLAEEVWSPEGALRVVSELQVIGGAFGDLNDPIRLMHMATNNVEGLQEALIGAGKSLVTFNNEQGKFEITGANLRRGRAMAKAMGIEYQELAKGAITAMERTQAATDLMSRGIDMDSEQVEFLTNLAQMRDGKMVIEVPEDLQTQLGGSIVELDNISKEQSDMLLKTREQFIDMDTEDIAREQYTAIDNIRHDISFITAKIRVGMGKEIGDAIEKFISPNIDQGFITRQSEELFDHVAEYIDKGQNVVSDMIDESLLGPVFGGTPSTGKLSNAGKTVNLPTENTTNETTPSEQTINHKHTYEFKSAEPIVDNVTRKAFRDLNLKFPKEEGSFVFLPTYTK